MPRYRVIPTIFPDKTSQVWKIDETILNGTGPVEIEWKFDNESEIMHLAQLKQLLQKHNLAALLYMPYLPYARQDKQIDNHATFGLHSFALLLNAMKFEEVTCYDTHSIIAKELIDNLVVKVPINAIGHAFDSVNPDLICYPDKGALRKYEKMVDAPFIFCDKTRDPLTGEITKTVIIGAEEAKDKTILIIDDLADAGGTFIKLAGELKKVGAKNIHLYVSHGLFTKGIQVLKSAGISRIFTKEGEIA